MSKFVSAAATGLPSSEPRGRIPAGARANIIADRRAFLRQLAAASALTIPVAAAAVAFADRDPVFAAIKNHRHLDAVFGEACKLTDEVAAKLEGRIITAAGQEIFDAAESAADEALEVLLATVPTTVAGIRAMLTYVFDKSVFGWQDKDHNQACMAAVLRSPVLAGGADV